MSNLPTYEQRVRAARERLRDSLAVITPQERAALEHTFHSVGDLPTMETLAMLAERAVSSARAEGYEAGWREGVEHGKTGGQP